jgi:hypothetical protein
VGVVGQWWLALRREVGSLAWSGAGFAAPLLGIAAGVGYLVLTGIDSGDPTNFWWATLAIGAGMWLVLGAGLSRLLRDTRPRA